MPHIEVVDLSLQINDTTILQNVNFTVERGTSLVIIGPSGSGKSSLLRCLNRLVEPSKGRIMLDSDDVTALDIIQLRLRVGMIFQKPAPFEGTVRDNILYGIQLRGGSLSDEELYDVLDRSALPHKLLDKKANALSGGQEQRLAIARALANKPEILLLDEPTSALDPIATRDVEETLLHLRDEHGLTLIWVSHQIEQARRVGQYVLFLEQGKLIRVDSVESMLDPETGDERVLAFAQGKHNTDQDNQEE